MILDGAEVAGKRILVVGLGVSGYSTARALSELHAKVRVTDSGETTEILRRAEKLRAIGIEVEIGGHDLEALDADAAVVSPGIPPTSPVMRALAEEGLLVMSEVELAYRLARCDFLAVTGTNGKTTTTSLLAAILQESGIQTVAAGNIGYPLIDAVAEIPAGGAVAVEVSSFQLASTQTFRPRVAVLLNVAEDHTDWHGSFEDYARAKALIVRNQTADDVFLPSADDPIAMDIAARCPSRVVPFSGSHLPEGGIGIEGDQVVWREEPVLGVDDIPLPGMPGLQDAIAALGAALEHGVERRAAARAVKAFRPLRHRMEIVAEKGGITFIDDSKATNPHATLAAVASLRDVVLIAGGRSKGIDLAPLARTVPPVTAVVALGEAREEIARVFDGLVPVESVVSMDEAVERACARVMPGGSVLLSPGCASLDMYTSYAARGDDFTRAVWDRITEGGGTHDGDS